MNLQQNIFSENGTAATIYNTQLTQAHSTKYSTTLEISQISHSQISKNSSQDNYLKPTKSKTMINSYLNLQRQKNSSLEKFRDTEQLKQKELSRNTSQKLTLISNPKDKQNKPSRANSKEKLHLTTLHPNIPSLAISSKIDMQNKENIQTQRDVFLNISITNPSEPTKRQYVEFKQRISLLQNELVMVHSSLDLTKLTLETKESILINYQKEIKDLNNKICILQMKYAHSKQSQSRLEQIESQNQERKRAQNRLRDQYQLLKNSVCLKNQKTNEVILNYENQISDLNRQIDQLRLHQNLDNMNTNRIIRQMEAQRLVLKNQNQAITQQYQLELGLLKQNISKLQGQSNNYKITISKLQSSITQQTHLMTSYQQKRLQEQQRQNQFNDLLYKFDALKYNFQDASRKIMTLTQVIKTNQYQLQKYSVTVQSLNRQKQLLSESLESLSQRLQSANRQFQNMLIEKQKMITLIQSLQKQNEIKSHLLQSLKKQNSQIRFKASSYQKSLFQSISVRQTLERNLQTHSLALITQKEIHVQSHQNEDMLIKENHQLRLQISNLTQENIKNQRLIIRIQQSIEDRLHQQSTKHKKEYEELYIQYTIVNERLESMLRKRKMQKAIIQDSKKFQQQIIKKCQQLNNSNHAEVYNK